jgi:hypothetical protein
MRASARMGTGGGASMWASDWTRGRGPQAAMASAIAMHAAQPKNRIQEFP